MDRVPPTRTKAVKYFPSRALCFKLTINNARPNEERTYFRFTFDMQALYPGAI